MRKDERKHKWDEHKIRWFLLESADEENIPESLKPTQMEQWLRLKSGERAGRGMQAEEQKIQEEDRNMQTEDQKMQAENRDMQTEDREIQMENMEEGRQKNEGNGSAGKPRHIRWWYGTFAAAACLALVLFAVGKSMDWSLAPATDDLAADDAALEKTEDGTADDVQPGQEGTTYAQLYQAFDKYWKEEEAAADDMKFESEAAADGAAPMDDAAADTAGESFAVDDAAVDDAAVDAAADSDMAMDRGDSDDMGPTVLDKGGSEEAESAEDLTSKESGETQDEAEGNYGKTNQQEKTVEEADIIKNDGRYLYRVMYRSDYKYTVRIIDTEGGLKEAAQVGAFEQIQDIYVWKDKLAVIEQLWAETGDEVYSMEDGVYDVWEPEHVYCRIYVYDISDRTNPQEYHTFTIKGSYKASRISDGYLYFFTSCDTARPEHEDGLRTYVPTLDGEPMAEDKITLPKEAQAASYLVMASVNMEKPDEFTDTRALVTSADSFYVSPENIYMADTQYIQYHQAGNQTDSTTLYRYSYKDGKMRKEAQGAVPGTLRDDMAMNEYQGYLRMVTTVEHQTVIKVIDDIMEEVIGFDSTDERTTNSLYVLDPDLEIVGKAEDLAPGERVYSARFMGTAGYFVTFRETDPLFSVDLTNPREPKILGELKISGFSEYLHFYADNLLLGIGMEADEETGETFSMKLSMFDTSNPADVKEQSKTELTGFEFSDALYNYKAVLIDTKKNIFGFSAEKYDDSNGDYKTFYMLFTYENGEFKKILEIDCTNDSRYGYSPRGTYIGDRFFLLAETGFVEEYSLIDASKTGELKP